MRSIAFYVVAVVFAGLAAYAAFFKPEAVWPMVVLAIAAAAGANLDRIGELSASLSGVKVILNRTEVAVDHLRRLVKQNAETQLALLQRSRRWDGWKEADVDEVYRESVKILRDHNIPETEISEILNKVWHPYVYIDYCSAITGGLSNRNMSKDEWAEWEKMTAGVIRPTADELEAFLSKMIVIDGLRREVLDDYRHYRKHGVGANPQAYQRMGELRKSTPTFIRELRTD